MDLKETTNWISQLFPGTPVISGRVTHIPAEGRHGRGHDSAPFGVAAFSLFDTASDDAAPGGDAVDSVPADSAAVNSRTEDAGDQADRRPETVAVTVDCGRVDCGLVAADGGDVRVELMSVGYADFPIVEVVAAAAAVVSEDAYSLSPIPGRVLPNAVRLAELAGEQVGGQFTVSHLLCVVPYVWPEGVPNSAEQAGHVNLHESDIDSPDGRVTTVTQLVPITGGEYLFYLDKGPEALMEMLAAADADLRDYRRDSVA